MLVNIHAHLLRDLKNECLNLDIINWKSLVIWEEFSYQGTGVLKIMKKVVFIREKRKELYQMSHSPI